MWEEVFTFISIAFNLLRLFLLFYINYILGLWPGVHLLSCLIPWPRVTCMLLVVSISWTNRRLALLINLICGGCRRRLPLTIQ